MSFSVLTSEPRQPAVFLLALDDEAPLMEEALTSHLPAATQSRIGAFKHPERRRQTRWGRLLAGAVAKTLRADLTEEPPYAPYLLQAGLRTALSVAHTGNHIALGVAGADDPVMGLDLEGVRPVRSLAGMCRMSFGTAADAVMKACDATGTLDPFFRAWCLKEAEIKLNRGASGWRLAVADSNELVVLTPDGVPACTTHHAKEHLRLSVVTRYTTPAIISLSPADVARVLQSV